MRSRRDRRPVPLGPWPALLAAAVGLALVPVGGTAHAADAPPPAPAPAVLAPIDPTASTAPAPTPAGVRAQIGPALSGRLAAASVLVVDPGTGTVLYARRADRPRIPASTTKILTAVAALSVLDPTERLPTSAYQDGRTVYLVGGGDPTLTRRGGGNPTAGGRASLQTLARKVAAATDPGAQVDVVYDASAFRGPRLGPGWSAGFPAAGVVAPVSALVVDSGRVGPGASARVADPARQAGQVFAQMLRAAGLRVGAVRAGTRPAGAAEVATVRSPPVADIVQRMLTESDNDYAEALAHLVGGRLLDRPTFAGGAAATEQALAGLGFAMTDVRLVDGSGLSERDRIPATTLVAVLADVARGGHPQSGTVAAGLPVAGLTGTLADRFTTAATRPGRGFVHAKTGTLTGVVALAGIVQDADGRVLVFAVLDNAVTSIPAARDGVDVVASRLAQCGCGA